MSNPTELPDLLPCPFCGGKGDYSSEEHGYRAYLSVLCTVCGSASEQVRYRSYDNGIDEETRDYIPPPERKADAAKLWNRRAQPEGEAPQADLSQVAALLYAALNDAYQASMFDGEELKRVVRAMSAYNRYRSSPAATLSPLCGAQHAESDAAIPIGVCWSEQRCDFYRADTGAGMGPAFYDQWRERADDFPSRDAARAALASRPAEAGDSRKPPRTSEEMVAFIGNHYNAMLDERGDPADIEYALTVHDLLSAMSDWFEEE